jgi:hypothetical protein
MREVQAYLCKTTLQVELCMEVKRDAFELSLTQFLLKKMDPRNQPNPPKVGKFWVGRGEIDQPHGWGVQPKICQNFKCLV